MNLLLVEPDEVGADGATVTIGAADRRFAHLRDVIGAAIGKTLRAGVLGGRLGSAEIVESDGDRIVLRLALGDVPAQLPIELVLAIPRPKVLSRVVEIAASFAIARIELTNAWRVDKSYLSSPRLAQASLAFAARLGAEQGGTTHVPVIDVHRRLMPLLDDRWPTASGPRAAAEVLLLAHPGGIPIESAAPFATGGVGNGIAVGDRGHGEDGRGSASFDGATRIVVAVGPEGGWIEREVETFVERGFTPVSLGAPILRVEAAVAALLGQLLLVRRRAR